MQITGFLEEMLISHGERKFMEKGFEKLVDLVNNLV